MDLGANEWVTFRKVTLPLIAPAILAALLLCFAISIDDFVVTYFVAGSRTTFPLFVWGAARVGAPPQVNVIAHVHLRCRRDRHGRERARSDAPRTSSRDRVSAPSVAPRLPPWWLDEAGRASRGARTGGGGSCRRLHRRRRVHGSVDRSGAEGARPFAARSCSSRPRPAARGRAVATAASCTVTGLDLRICFRCSDEERALQLARAGERIVPAVRAFCESRGEDVWLRESGMLMVSAAPAQDDAVDHAVAAAAEVGAPEQAVPLDAERRRGANSLSRLPAGCLLPGRRDGAAGAARARATPCGCRCRRRAVRADARASHSQPGMSQHRAAAFALRRSSSRSMPPPPAGARLRVT